MSSYVGIHPNAFARAKLVDTRLYLERGFTIGKMALLWSETQSLGITECSLDELIGWLDFKKSSQFLRWIDAILTPDVRFLLCVKPDRYVINGNDERIERIKIQKEKSSKGGKARQRQLRKDPRGLPVAEPEASLRLSLNPASGEPVPQPTGTGTGTGERDTNVSLVGSGRSDAPSPRELATLWNGARAATMPAVNLGTFKPGKRWDHAKTRLREEPSLDYWRQVIERIAASSFCRGEKTDWKATFDWLVKRETHVRVMEGQYDDRKQQASGVDAWLAQMQAEGQE